jgi:hypothetical protein
MDIIIHPHSSKASFAYDAAWRQAIDKIGKKNDRAIVVVVNYRKEIKEPSELFDKKMALINFY